MRSGIKGIAFLRPLQFIKGSAGIQFLIISNGKKDVYFCKVWFKEACFGKFF